MKAVRPTYPALIAVIAIGLTSSLFATDALPVLSADGTPSVSSLPQINIPTPRARMSWDLALQAYELRSARQVVELGEYEDVTTIEAELPQTAQKGRFELRRIFTAPKSLAFKAVNFVGDGFVKTNVIARLLQSEVDHVQKGDTASTAINSDNYKFSFKGEDIIDGQSVHVFQVKPRKKRVGLFKGKVYLDVYSGTMRRAEGRMVKSPSFFVKKIDFVQDYAQIGEFSLVSHLRSVAEVRILGRAVVDITHDHYQARRAAQQQSRLQPVAIP